MKPNPKMQSNEGTTFRQSGLCISSKNMTEESLCPTRATLIGTTQSSSHPSIEIGRIVPEQKDVKDDKFKKFTEDDEFKIFLDHTFAREEDSQYDGFNKLFEAINPISSFDHNGYGCSDVHHPHAASKKRSANETHSFSKKVARQSLSSRDAQNAFRTEKECSGEFDNFCVNRAFKAKKGHSERSESLNLTRNNERNAEISCHTSSSCSNENVNSIHFFSCAMMESQRSQNIILESDKRMGLKKSHSKTMSLSSQSRQELQILLRSYV